MREYTSNSLQKIISKLMDKKGLIISEINTSATFTASVSENLAELRSENALDIADKIGKIEFINTTILNIKHAKNVFNTEYHMPINKMTIDEAIVRLAMLNEEKSMLHRLRENKIKERSIRGISKEPEYTYITYDIKYAKDKYDEVFDEIQSIQEELNDINSSVLIEVEIDEEAIARL